MRHSSHHAMPAGLLPCFFSRVRGRRVLRSWTSIIRDCPKLALRVDLLLDHRFGWPRGGYGVRVPMHYLPGAILWSKDHRNPKIAGGDLFPSTDLPIGPLYPTNVGQFGRDVFGNDLESVDLPISVVRCAKLLSFCDPFPPAHGRAEGVG